MLYGGFARGAARRGDPDAARFNEALAEIIRHGWASDNPSMRQVFTSRFIPDADAERVNWFNELCRRTTSPEMAAEFIRTHAEIDVTHCVGAYAGDGRQVGFARFISDYTTYCYVCDIYVLESERGHGLAGEMIALAMQHPRLKGLRRWGLVTKGAQKVYAQVGFKPVAHPERHMEVNVLDIYRQKALDIPA